MARFISEAVAVLPLAEALVRAHHPHLADCRLRFLFTDQESRGGGCRGWAKMTVLSPVVRHLSRGLADAGVVGDRLGDDVAFVIAADAWSRWSPELRAARVDHLLAHVQRDDATGLYSRREHTVGEFVDVIRRHGARLTDARLLGPELRQLALEVPEGGIFADPDAPEEVLAEHPDGEPGPDSEGETAPRPRGRRNGAAPAPTPIREGV